MKTEIGKRLEIYQRARKDMFYPTLIWMILAFIAGFLIGGLK